jgi:signal transduction histidine kinase
MIFKKGASRPRPASAGRLAFYRLRPVSETEASVNVTEEPSGNGDESRRVADARARAEQRLRRQRGTLRPLGWAMGVVVAAGTFGGHPAPGLHGKATAVTLAMCVFIATLALTIRDRFTELGYGVQASVIAAMGAAGVALGALQPRGATELAGGAAVWMAVARLPLAWGVPLGAAITVALDVAAAFAGSSGTAIFAATLLCVLLGLIAGFMRQARESQDRSEVLMAELEDAREEQTRAAAIAERGRIASELHDVLAHSLSGAAIQLQGARMLADRERAEEPMRVAIDRASELVKDGLANARQAVGALRGEELPGVAQLGPLVESFRHDMNLDVTMRIEGIARAVAADASLALYRGAQEALTNVARYAPGASTMVVLTYDADRAILTVENRVPDGVGSAQGGDGLTGVGGGRGLAGMRERVERAGGTMRAGPSDGGWRVELEVPA